MRLILFLGIAQVTPRAEIADAKPKPPSLHSVVVMDPVNLETEVTVSEWGTSLRRIFAGLPGWKVIAQEKMEGKLREYNVNPSAPCREFQCAFDAGNILLAEYVVYGTVTRVDDWQAFTMNIVHMPTSQVVFAKAGEVRRAKEAGPGSAAQGAVLEGAWQRVLEDLDPAALGAGRREKKGLITVLDLSAGMPASRVLTDRLAAHLQASRSFDIMTQQEQRELLAALEIDKAKFVPSDSSIFWLGGKMGVSHLLYSRLSGVTPDYSLGLALYDMAARKKVREWPTKSMGNFRKLLLNEDKFFSGLFDAPVVLNAKPARSKNGYWAGAGLGLTLSGLAAVAAVSASRESNHQYDLYRQALSFQEAKLRQDRVQVKDRETWMFGGGAGLLLLLSVTSFTLSF